MKDFKNLIEQCDADIKAGLIHAVPRRLAQLNTARVPREWRLPLANICRRASLYSMGLTLLDRLVQPTSRHPEPLATPKELAEYCVLLMRIGAVNESLQRLQGIDPKLVPDVFLFRAFGHFYRWEFTEAISSLESYLQAPISDYAKLVGKVNLAHALVESGQHALAKNLLEENIQNANAGGNFNLQSLSHVYRSQIRMAEEDFSAARQDLEAAKSLLGESWTKIGIIQKWLLLSEAMETKSQEPIERLRVLSREHQDWEAIREVDLFSLKLSYDHVRFLHLIFGTPLQGYRNRIYNETGKLPERTVYVLGKKTTPRFDLTTGEINGQKALNPGRKCHQLIELLLRDFYEPRRIGSLFFDLFPGEYYNVATSPHRVHQIIFRTRQWFETQNIPIQIAETNGFYSLQIVGSFSFRVPLERQPVALVNLQFEKLKALLPADDTFTLREAQAKLNHSKCTVWRLLSWGIDNGKVERLGSNNSTLYKIVRQPSKVVQTAA